MAMLLSKVFPDDPAPVVERKPYIEGRTAVHDYTLNYTPSSRELVELRMSPEYILMQSAPKWAQMAASALFGKSNYSSMPSERRNITILDARQEQLDFAKTGFTLVTMPKESQTQDWRGTDDIKTFHSEFEPEIRKLFPTVKRIEWTYNVIRNGVKFGDQPAAVNALHLDFTQNDSARSQYHRKYSPFPMDKTVPILLGEHDTEDEELGALLGVWKPAHMSTPVCDKPLLLMDASTFSADEERPYEVHIDFMVANLHNLNGAITYSPRQKLYYYPFQTTREVLVFHQYSRGRHFANPHGSFLNPNCPSDSQPRISVEMRVGLFFSKTKNA